MGTPDGDWLDTSQEARYVERWVTYKLLLVATTFLLYYEYLITLADEIRLVWQRRWTFAAVLVILIRYGFLVDVTLMTLYRVGRSVTLTAESCRAIYAAEASLQLVNYSMISLFVAVRNIALWSRNMYLGIFLFISGVVSSPSLTQLLMSGLMAEREPWPMPTCVMAIPETHPMLEVIMFWPVASSVTSIAYEMLCLGLTISKTFGHYREQRRVGMRTPLVKLLLHDGFLYFMVMLALALSNITSAPMPLSDRSFPMNSISTLSRALTPILTTRFISHLRQVDDPDETRNRMQSLPTIDSGASTGTIEFRSPPSTGDRFIGSLGGDLDFGDEAESDD